MSLNKQECPICRRAVGEQFRPFCSERCKMVDLGRWLSNTYAIPDKEPATLPAKDEQSEEQE